MLAAALTLAALAQDIPPDPPRVVWLEDDVPTEKVRGKTDALVGDSAHYAHALLAFPPEPAGPADDAAYTRLKAAVDSAKARWDDFEVEFGIATDLESALAPIDAIRTDDDLEALIAARALQGAAVHRAFDLAEFQNGDRAAPFRVKFFGTSYLNKPWVDAIALDADQRIGQDLADPSTWSDLQAMQAEVGQLDEGTLDLAGLPPGAILIVDGRPVGAVKKVGLPIGTHYISATVQGPIIGGRQKIDILPRESIPVPLVVSKEELRKAHDTWLSDDPGALPPDVVIALDKAAAAPGGPVFVAVEDDGKVVVRPWSKDAKVKSKKPVTVLFTGDLGPEIIISPLFGSSDGRPTAEATTAPAVSGSLGLEIGIYNGAILGGMDFAFAPGKEIWYANGDATRNVKSSALPQPWGGIGVYALRPNMRRPTLLFAGTYGWNGPAHYAFGGRFIMGIPLQDDGAWLRISIGGSSAARSAWDKLPENEADGLNTPMHTMFLRVGLSQRF